MSLKRLRFFWDLSIIITWWPLGGNGSAFQQKKHWRWGVVMHSFTSCVLHNSRGHHSHRPYQDNQSLDLDTVPSLGYTLLFKSLFCSASDPGSQRTSQCKWFWGTFLKNEAALGFSHNLLVFCWLHRHCWVWQNLPAAVPHYPFSSFHKKNL